MLAPLVVLFIAVPLAELYVIIQVGQEIGALPTIAILVADSILGSMLMRAQGRTAWRNFNAAVAAGRVPAREVLDGALVIFGGALLLTPGFLTDILGLLLLVPPTRAFFRGVLVRRFTGGLLVGMAGRRRAPRGPAPGSPYPPSPPRGGRDYDVEGTATEIERDRLP